MYMKIFLLHGWNQDKNIWNGLVDKLDERCVAFDLPGFGKETLSDKNWGIVEYTNWAKLKIENNLNKGERAILLGHSFGGRIALEIAAKNPKWLVGLILSGSPNLYRPKIWIKVKILIGKLFKYILPARVKNLFLPSELKEAYVKHMEKVFKKVIKHDQTNLLDSVGVPTLLIWGENDRQVPLTIAHEMEMKIKNSKLLIIGNAGHNAFLDNQNLYIGYVKEFIRNIK